MGDILSIGVYIFLFVTLYFEVFLLMTFFEAKPLRRREKREPRYFPSVAVIVPCYNEEKTLVRTVESLLDLDYPKEKLRVLIVDDGSTDSTWEVMQRFEDHPSVSLYRKANGGKHTALNLGIAESQSELVGCLDADSYVMPSALKEIVKTFEKPGIMAVTPAMMTAPARTIIQYVQQAEYSLSIFMRRMFAHLNGIFVTPGPFSIFRREVFEKLGTYRAAHNTEDLEMALRMQKHHMRIENAPTVHVYTNTPQTVRGLYRQRLRWVYGFLKNALDYRALFFKREYGNLGIFILPVAVVAIFSALYLVTVLFYGLAMRFMEKLVEIRAIGVQLPHLEFQFDWFFMNTSLYLFLIVITLSVTVTLILIGKRIADDRVGLPIDIVLYLSLYGFLAPWWLARAVYNASRSIQTDWTAERRA